MTIKLAIIGPGKIASKKLAPAVNHAKGTELWSVYSRSQQRAKEFADQFHVSSPQPAFDSFESLLEDSELDGVIIATPDKLHAQQTIKAAEAGKHVLVEKPMATNLVEAKQMIDACATNRVNLGVAYHLRWHDGHRKIAQAITDGELGTLRHIRIHWSWSAEDNSNWRASEEIGKWWGLAGVGTHCLDLIRWFMTPNCGEVKELTSTVSCSKWGGPHDETAVVSMMFDSGATAELCTSVLFDAPKRLEIYGSKNYILCDDTLGANGAGIIQTRDGKIDFQGQDPYLGEIEDFVRSIKEKRHPEVSGEEGLRNVELLLQAGR